MQLFPVYLSCVHPPRGRTWLHRRNVDRLLWDGPWLELPPLACFVESDVRLVCDGASKQSIGCCVWRHKTNGSKTSERIVYLWQSMNFVYNYNIVYNNILHVHVLLNYSSIIFIPYRFCPNHAPCIPTHVYKDLSMYYYYCCTCRMYHMYHSHTCWYNDTSHGVHTLYFQTCCKCSMPNMYIGWAGPLTIASVDS